jgi:predicted negative regulator of RcsB-dependent stress response
MVIMEEKEIENLTLWTRPTIIVLIVAGILIICSFFAPSILVRSSTGGKSEKKSRKYS